MNTTLNQLLVLVLLGILISFYSCKKSEIKPIHACGFSQSVSDQELLEDPDVPLDSSFIYIVEKLRSVAFINTEIIVEAKDQDEIAVAYELLGKNRIRYNRQEIDRFFLENPFDFNRAWPDKFWSAQDKKFFQYFFIAAHELAHIINDDNVFTTGCASYEERKRRELNADFTAAYMLYTIGIGPVHYFNETLQQHHTIDECYPDLSERYKYVELGYKKALADNASNPIQYSIDKGPNPDHYEIYPSRYDVKRGFTDFWGPNKEGASQFIFTGQDSEENIHSSFFRNHLGERYLDIDIPHTQLYAQKSHLVSAFSYYSKLDTMNHTSIYSLLDQPVFFNDNSGYFLKRTIKNYIDTGFSLSGIGTKIEPDTVYFKEVLYRDSTTTLIVDSVLYSVESVIDLNTGVVQNTFDRPITLISNLGEDDHSNYDHLDTIHPYLITTNPYDINGSENYDMGWSLDIDNYSKKIGDPNLYWAATPIYVVNNCGALSGVVVRTESDLPCPRTAIGYLFFDQNW